MMAEEEVRLRPIFKAIIHLTALTWLLCAQLAAMRLQMKQMQIAFMTMATENEELKKALQAKNETQSHLGHLLSAQGELLLTTKNRYRQSLPRTRIPAKS
jgi:regulator of replication initiation timing